MSASSSLKVFASPERYVQGRGASKHLGAEMKKLSINGPVVVVASATPKRLCEDNWSKSLQEAGYEFVNILFNGTCTAAEAQRLADEATKIDAKAMIAFGGGQVIDAVRAACNLVGDGSVCEFISCPTVASTDGPCSALCVMYHADHSFHEYRDARRHPTLVVVDTEAVAQAPPRMLVGGLGDALATWYEARTIMEAKNKQNFLGGMPTETSTALSKLCCSILLEDGAAAVKAVQAKAVTPSLERVVEANTLLSGLGFESGGLCVAHSIHNGLTSQKETNAYTHGEKGLPLTLKDLGVDVTNETAVKQIAESALAPGESAHNEPFEVSVDMMVDAIQAADHAGSLFEESKKN